MTTPADPALSQALVDEGVVRDVSKAFDLQGCLCCIAVIASWVAQSEVAQSVQISGYNKPMAITWANHSAGVLVAPVLLLFGGSLAEWRAALTGSMSGRRVLLSSLGLATLYLLADWVWYVGLPFTSVAAGTAIFNTSSCWVYALSVAFLGRQHRGLHTFALVLSLLGVCVVCFRPGDNKATLTSESPSAQLLGNCFVLLAAICYAAYEVILYRSLEHAQPLNAFTTAAFISFCGLVNLVVLWPVVLVLAAPGIPELIAEDPELPSTTLLRNLCINAALATCFNVSLALAIVRTSPLTTSVTCMLTIPVSLVVDMVAHGDTFGSIELAGSVLIIIGFLVLTFSAPS